MKLTNVAWNLGGLGVPVLAGILAIPELLAEIGFERFGILSLAWGMLGFAGLFDLGIGKSTTRLISSAIGKCQFDIIPNILKISTFLSLKAGVLGTVLFTLLVAFDAQTLLKYSKVLEDEIKYAAYILAIIIPIQALSAMYRGVNEAFGNFKGISVVRAASTSATFLLPLAVSQVSVNCAWLIFSLLISRFLGLIAYHRLAHTQIGRTKVSSSKKGKLLEEIYSIDTKELLKFGSWFTLSSILYPAMGQIDRFLIGTKLSVADVAAYTIPFDLIMQLLIIPGAITTVLFPTITKLVQTDFKLSEKIFLRWFGFAILIMTIVALCGLLAIPDALQYWLKQSLEHEAILAAKIVFFSLIPYTVGTLLIVQAHARNRPEIPAISHIVQFVIFAPTSYFFITQFGLVGAAISWTARITFDAVVLATWYMYARKNIR